MSLQRGRGAGRRHIKEPFGTTVEFLLSRSRRAADQSKEKELEEWRHDGDNMALGDLLSFIAAAQTRWDRIHKNFRFLPNRGHYKQFSKSLNTAGFKVLHVMLII